jgi:hypothetical protein
MARTKALPGPGFLDTARAFDTYADRRPVVNRLYEDVDQATHALAASLAGAPPVLDAAERLVLAMVRTIFRERRKLTRSREVPR